jgi:hypothetical protein
VFPFSLPSVRSGRGAIVWLGGAPQCGRTARAGTTLDVASLHSDDELSIPRALWRGRGLVGPLETASTTAGQIVAAFGDGAGAAYGETDDAAGISALTPLDGPPALVATANGYIGDADIVSTALRGGSQEIVLRAQRHYASSFGSPVSFPVGSAPISALIVAMDFRADSIVVWAQSGTVYARWITNSGRVFPARTLGPGGDAPQLAAVLSDNTHAFVAWTDEPAPGAAGAATIYLEHSGRDVTFTGTPRVLARFTEPAQQRLTPGSIGLVRITPSEGVMVVWTSVSSAGNYIVSAAGVTSGGPLPATTIAQPGVDLRLAALATGPHDDVVVVLESAPRTARGFDYDYQSILASRTVPGGPGGFSFETPTELAAPGPNGAPAVGVDPDTDRAVVAWQTTAGGMPAVAYAVRAAP